MTLFFSCEKEIELPKETETSQSRYQVSTIDMDDLKANQKIFNKLKSLNKTNEINASSPLGREVYSQEYGFVIETVFVKYLEDIETGHHSYNFPILKWDNPPSNKVFNLLFSSRIDGDYDVYIIQYGFTKEEYEIVDISQLQGVSTKYKSIVFDELDDLVPNNETRFVWDCDESWVMSNPTDHNGDFAWGRQ